MAGISNLPVLYVGNVDLTFRLAFPADWIDAGVSWLKATSLARIWAKAFARTDSRRYWWRWRNVSPNILILFFIFVRKNGYNCAAL